MAWWHKEIEDLELEIVFLKNELQKANLVNMRLTKQLTLTDVSQQRELLLGFLDKLERIDALKQAKNWQKKSYVASYLKDK